MEEKNLEKDLREIVGDRVTTSDFERWFYTSDLIPIPGMIKSLFRTMPAAVVKPGTVQEVGAVLSYCSYKKIAVVARGGGSSGLFGAVPKKGGVVLDLTDLSDVVEVDQVRESVTTEAGITWWELDRKLRSEGLTVRSYPSSAKSATVGGWMMGNGLGIGSLKYGSLFDQLLSAQVVLSDGTVREYARGQGLEWFFESEGMLGVVTKISFKIRRI
ncbi:MAG: FAD-binding oxidoreductase, partial [Syntrophales bacterium]|nr:FAD-binding oxidoreductase [Syntrophales bacterium]